MGFFKDFKRDFAQAVNELMPDKDELANEYDDEDMVNTFDDKDNMEIAPEDMLENLDDFSIDKSNSASSDNMSDDEQEKPETDYEDEEEKTEQNVFDTVPEAEIIPDLSADSVDFDEDTEFQKETVVELLQNEESQVINKDSMDDEIKSLNELDDADMLENTDDASSLEDLDIDNISDDFMNVDLEKAVEDAILKSEEDKAVESDAFHSAEEDAMAELESNATQLENELKNKEQDISSVMSDDTTYITKGTTIKGDIKTDGGIDVIGNVEGNVTCEGKLIVGGSIKGNVDAGEVYANAAKIEGEILATGSVKVGVGSVVVGDVTATSAVIAGAVNGDIDVQGPVIVDSTAVIMGNIKSRSVQINNGAVIEGFCSQCYSEIDVKSFFD